MTLKSAKGHDGPPAKTPVILALEASGDLLAAAVWADGAVQNHQAHAARHGHAAHIATLVEQVMKTAAVDFTDITHVAAGRGPGSFTGTRVALAAAKGFCLATGTKGMGISGLAALAAHCNHGVPVLVSAETRRGPCYAQFFDSDGSALTPILETALADIVASLPAGLSELVIAGWQADELAAGLAAAGSGILVEAVHAKTRVDATHIAAFAAALIEAGYAGEAMTPLYLAPAFLGPAKQAGK